MGAAVWVLFLYVHVNGIWAPMPMPSNIITTKAECLHFGQGVAANLSQKTNSDIKDFFCTQAAEEDAKMIVSKMGVDVNPAE